MRHHWDLAAAIWATVVNLLKGKDADAVNEWDIHPLRTRADYQADTVKDQAYHRDRRLRMLPHSQRRRVVARLRERGEMIDGEIN